MATRPVEPKPISRDKVLAFEALKPGYNWARQIPAPGHSAVDFEERVDFRRLHDWRDRSSASTTTTSAISPAP